MNTRDSRGNRLGDRAIVLIAISVFCVTCGLHDTMASEISKFELTVWESLCAQALPGTTPTWRTRAEFKSWLKDQEVRIEPVIVKWLHNNRDSIEWKQGMFVAKKIPTKAIRDAVFENISHSVAAIKAKGGTLRNARPELYVGSVSILAEGHDPRAVPLLNDLVLVDKCSYRIATKYLKALRKVGDATSLPALGKMPLRKTNERINRMAALTEKIIEARVAGKVFPSETASEELRALTRRFLKASEAASLQAYNACFPWGFDKVRDEGDMHEFLDGEHGKPALAAIRAALEANAPFEISRETLQAKLVCGGNYSLEYIYEVDGWKVMKIMPLSPIRANNNEPLRTNPQKNDSNRVMIGKPAKDKEKP